MTAKEIFDTIDLSPIDELFEIVDREINISTNVELETIKGVEPKTYYSLGLDVIGEADYDYDNNSVNVRFGNVVSVEFSYITFVGESDEEVELSEEVCLELDKLLEEYIKNLF